MPKDKNQQQFTYRLVDKKTGHLSPLSPKIAEYWMERLNGKGEERFYILKMLRQGASPRSLKNGH